MSQSKPALRCQISVRTAASSHTYSGIFRSTFDALIDALGRLEGVSAKVTVRAVRS